MKHRAFVSSCTWIAVLVSGNALLAQTTTSKSSPSPSPSLAAKQNPRPLPFHGMVTAVDQKAKTFTITGKQASRVFKVTDKTVINKGAGAAAMKDIVENEEISGSYWKNPDGTCEAKMVKLGPLTPPKKTQSAISPTVSPKS